MKSNTQLSTVKFKLPGKSGEYKIIATLKVYDGPPGPQDSFEYAIFLGDHLVKTGRRQLTAGVTDWAKQVLERLEEFILFREHWEPVYKDPVYSDLPEAVSDTKAPKTAV